MMIAAQRGFAFVSQPIFEYCEIESYRRVLDGERLKTIYPFRTELENGITLAFSTDAPATSWAVPSDPFANLKAAVQRKAYDGTDIGQDESIDIEGTLSLTGSRVKMNITTEDIVGVFEKALCSLFSALADAIKQIPIDYVEEIFENGIILTGGGALVYGLDKLMSKILGVSVKVPQDPIDCVAKGLSRINAFMPVRMRSNNKNITANISKYYETKKNGK
jgi:cell division ATPase FtsA